MVPPVRTSVSAKYQTYTFSMRQYDPYKFQNTLEDVSTSTSFLQWYINTWNLKKVLRRLSDSEIIRSNISFGCTVY